MSEVLIYILMVIIILLVLILLVPVHFNFTGRYAQTARFQGQVDWAGGLLRLEAIYSEGKIGLELGFLGLRKKIRNKAGKVPEGKESSQTRERTRSKDDILSIINPRLFAEVKAVFSRLVQALHLGLNLAGTFGFDDPSLTGILTGIIAAFNRGGTAIDINPDFTREVADIQGSIWGWLVPLQILAIGVMFLFKQPVRAIWWSKIKINRKKKEVVQYA